MRVPPASAWRRCWLQEQGAAGRAEAFDLRSEVGKEARPHFSSLASWGGSSLLAPAAMKIGIYITLAVHLGSTLKA